MRCFLHRASAKLPFRGILLCALTLVAGCDYTVDIRGTTYQFQRMEYVSAVPATKNADNTYSPVCDGSGNAVLMTVNLVGSQTNVAAGSGEADLDLSMRPGDVIKTFGGDTRFALIEGSTISESLFNVTVDCLDPYPDPDLVTGTSVCQGVANPGAVQGVQPAWLHYQSDFPISDKGSYARPFGQKDKIGVAILIDMSGSMNGFVDKETYQEASPNLSPAPWDSTNFKQYGSDPTNHRIAVVKDFMNLLNPDEKSIVFRYSEDVGVSPKVVCANQDGLAENDLRSECYGTNRANVLSPSGTSSVSALDAIQAYAKGRTPLWAAVSEVYDFMKAAPSTEVRHMLVIGDGPDTCSIDSPDYNPKMGGLCSSIGFGQFLQKVQTDLATPGVPRVHVNFVQFQGKGYVVRDPLQEQIACVTGGKYVFVNSQDLPQSSAQALNEALKDAMSKVRYTLAGAWTMAIDVPDLANPGLPKGTHVALNGVITLAGQDGSIAKLNQSLLLRVGKESPIPGLGALDLRAAVKVPCGAPAECGWLADVDECHNKSCLASGSVCGADRKADLTTCGAAGVCCAGACFEGVTECPVQ